jgi:hypothetical protein
MSIRAECLNEYKPIEERLGQIGVNKLGEYMEVIKCYPNYRVDVKFLDGNDCIINIKYDNFRRGVAKNYNRVEYGFHGYLGQGPYVTGYRENGKKYMTPEFNVWLSMHRRSENFNGEKPSYEDVTICKEWWNFQNFAKWYNENIYECNERLCLDKDILIPKNKIYSPEACRLVPDSLNQLFKQQPEKDNNLPIGVYYDNGNKNKPYRTCKLYYVNEDGEVHLTQESFKTPNEAFELYKSYKEKYIRDCAEFYKGKIPIEIYNALKTYKFELYN